MAVCFFTSSGGDGADTSVVTAGAEDVLSGKVIVDANGNPLTGTMTNRGAISQSLGINGSYTIPQGYHNGSGKVSQSISTMGAQTITPKSSAQTVSCNGKYMTGNITVNAANIYKVVTGTATVVKTITFLYYSTTYYGWSVSPSGFTSISCVFWSTSDPRGSVAFSVSSSNGYYVITGSDRTSTKITTYDYMQSGGAPVIAPSLIKLPASLKNTVTVGNTIYYTIIGTGS